MWFCATWYRLSGIKPLLVGLLFCLLLNVICILFYRYSIMEMPASQHKNYGIYITSSFPFALSTASLPAVVPYRFSVSSQFALSSGHGRNVLRIGLFASTIEAFFPTYVNSYASSPSSTSLESICFNNGQLLLTGSQLKKVKKKRRMKPNVSYAS